jgi:hypothetical protein
MCQLKQFTPFFTRICSSQEVGQVSDQTALQEDEEAAIQNVPGNQSDDHIGLLIILDNILPVGKSAGGKERAGWPQPQSGGLPEGAEGGKKNGAAANFSEVLQW